MPGFIGYSIRALGRTRVAPPRYWVVLAALAWGLTFALPGWGVGPVTSLALWGGALLVLSGLALARWFHPTLLFPSVSMAMSSMAVASVLSLGTSYEQAIDNLTAKTQGDAVITRSGRDFHEYKTVAPGLETLSAVAVAVPFVHVEGLAQAKGKSDGPPLSKGMALRGIAPEVLARSRIFSRARSQQSLSPPLAADRDRRPGLWMGKGLAQGIGAQIGDLVLLTVWSRKARRDEDGLYYDYSPRERLFVLDAVFETGDAQLDEHLAVSALSAAQALAHGRAWVTGIDVEWDPSVDLDESQRLTQVQGWLKSHAKLCRVSSWRQSPERDEQRRRFLALGAVLSFGLMSSSTVSLVLGVMVLFRLRAHFFRTMHAMGATQAQLRRILGALLASSLVLAMLLFLAWWFMLVLLGPAVSFSVDVLGELRLSWSLSGRDAVWILAWLGLSYMAAHAMLSRQVRQLGR